MDHSTISYLLAPVLCRVCCASYNIADYILFQLISRDLNLLLCLWVYGLRPLIWLPLPLPVFFSNELINLTRSYIPVHLLHLEIHHYQSKNRIVAPIASLRAFQGLPDKVHCDVAVCGEVKELGCWRGCSARGKADAIHMLLQVALN